MVVKERKKKDNNKFENEIDNGDRFEESIATIILKKTFFPLAASNVNGHLYI